MVCASVCVGVRIPITYASSIHIPPTEMHSTATPRKLSAHKARLKSVSGAVSPADTGNRSCVQASRRAAVSVSELTLRPPGVKEDEYLGLNTPCASNRDSDVDALQLLVEGMRTGVLERAVIPERTRREIPAKDKNKRLITGDCARDSHDSSRAIHDTRELLERSVASSYTSTSTVDSVQATMVTTASAQSIPPRSRTASNAVRIRMKKRPNDMKSLKDAAALPPGERRSKGSKVRVVSKMDNGATTRERPSGWSSSKHRAQRSAKMGLGNMIGSKNNENAKIRRSGNEHMKAFLMEIGNTGLLSKNQEIELVTSAQECIRLETIQSSLAEKLGYNPTIQDLAIEAQLPENVVRKRMNKGKVAKRLMVEHNVRLAVHVARHYINMGVPMGDLVQEGISGLVRAIEKFDPKLGYRFSTYAHYWVRQGIVRAVSDQSRTIRLPVHVYDTLSKIRKAQIALEDRSPEGPTDKDVANYLGLPEAKVTQILNASLPVVDLDGTLYNNTNKDSKETAKLEAVQSEESPESAPEGSCELIFLEDDLQAALASLHPRERNILCMRYGLATPDGKTMTLKDIGRAYGLTRERIRQIEEKALCKLRQPDYSLHLKEYMHVLSQ